MIPKSGDRFSEEIMRQAKVLGITEITPQLMATATLRLDTPGASFTDITSHVAGFIAQIGAGEGALPPPQAVRAAAAARAKRAWS